LALDIKNSSSVPLVAAIAAVGVIVAFSSFLYSNYNSDLLSRSAVNDIQKTARAQTNDVARILENKVIDVRNNLILISETNTIKTQQVEEAKPLFTAASETTRGFTNTYFWLDRDGRAVWSSAFNNATLYEQFGGADRSDKPYYTVPKESHAFHVTSIMESTDEVLRLFLSYPILGTSEVQGQATGASRTFNGVIGASANLLDIGQFLNSQLSPDVTNSIGLLGTDGTILYSENQTLIGQNYWSEQFQNTLPGDLRIDLNPVIEKSLRSTALEQAELSYNGNTGTIVYEPIVVDGNTVAVLYIVAPHNLAGETLTVLDNQRNFTILIIAALAAVALAASIAVARWNKRLSNMITARTKELQFANESLKAKSNELADALHTIGQANLRLEEANEQLKIHDRLQKEFVNVAAHELRTPIQPLLGAAELIESQLEGKEEIKVTRAEVEMIVRNAKRLERLSSDILEIARIESDALTLHREHFSLSYIISDAVKDAKAQSHYDPDKVKIRYAPDDIFVYADREKAIQVISNLLTNAIKFTTQGFISIKTSLNEGKDFAVVTVTDTGTGIDPEVISKLFEKFVTRSEKGTGIGLYISKKILEAHGCEIAGMNNPDGVGAEFSFTLPLSSEQRVRRSGERA